MKFLLLLTALFAAGVVIGQSAAMGLDSVRSEIYLWGNPSMTGTFVSIALIGTSWEPLAWGVALLLGRTTPLLVLIVYRVVRHASR